MSVVSMKELLEAGVHFGHQTKRWDPRMKPFIFTQRKGIHILDLQKTVDYVDKAYAFVKQVVAKGGNILFVGTKKQAQEAIEKEAQRCEMPYVSNRWIGGLLTNFATIMKSKQKLDEYEGILDDPLKEKNYTKKEILKFQKLRDKMLKPLGGIRNLNRIPDAMFVIDPSIETTAIKEARKMKVPIVSVVDTNCNPLVIDYPIPGNDDAIRAVNLFAGVIANAVISGKKELQMTKEGTEETSESLENVAYVSRVDKATEEEMGTQTSFSPDEDYLPVEKMSAQVAQPTEEEILREQYQAEKK